MYWFNTAWSLNDTAEYSREFFIASKHKALLPAVQKAIESDRGSCMAISGPPGSGKHTFLEIAVQNTRKNALAIEAEEIKVNGILNMSKLHKTIRSMVTVVIKEQMKIIEGEVVSLTSDRIQLKTRDMEAVFELGVRMRRELERERVNTGDIVKIYKESCFVTRMGRPVERNETSRPDLLSKINLPEGECIKNETVETRITLNELDVLSSREDGEEYLYSDVDVCEYIREEVNNRVLKLLKERKAVLERGVVVIEGCEALTADEIGCIPAICRGELHPTVFLNFGQEPVQVSEVIYIRLNPYENSEIREIIKNYGARMSIEIDGDALELLTETGQSVSLSHAIKVLRASKSGKSVRSSEVKKIVDVFAA